jgi:hypothetical protein
MKMPLLLAALIFAGCTSAPLAVDPKSISVASMATPATPQAVVSSTFSAGPAVQTPGAQKVELVAGYKLMMKDGTEYFCRKEAPTGTKVKKLEQCFTREQMSAEAVEARRQIRALDPGTMPEQAAPVGVPAGFN